LEGGGSAVSDPMETGEAETAVVVENEEVEKTQMEVQATHNEEPKDAPPEEATASEVPSEADQQEPTQAVKEDSAEVAKEEHAEAAKEEPVEAAQEEQAEAAKEEQAEAAKEDPAETAKEDPAQTAPTVEEEQAAKPAAAAVVEEEPAEAAKEEHAQAAPAVKEEIAAKPAAAAVVKEEPAEVAKEKIAQAAPKVEEEPAAKPAAAAAESAVTPTAKKAGVPKTPLVDTASLGKGGGLIGDDEEKAFVPQAVPAPSLSQYTTKAKEANSKVELNKHDVDAWKVLIAEVQTGAMKHLASEIFERVLEVFPTSGRHWLSYANTYVAENKKSQAIAVLQRALPHCPHVDLWRAFLIHYVGMNVGLTKDAVEIGKAYERAVECVGQDIAANAVWNDYINFLKNSKVANQYEKSQNMFQLRRAFHRALLVPMHQMERLWSDYEEWEKAADPNNPHAAEVLLREWEPKHKAARASFKDRKKLRDSIAQAERASSVLSVLPGPCTGDQKEKAVLDAWMALINYEKSNPQKMAAEDLRRRVGFTLKQAHTPPTPFRANELLRIGPLN